ncbi:MAG: hypothetical protein ACREUE_02390, partial [Panacagrimonas sp.]
VIASFFDAEPDASRIPWDGLTKPTAGDYREAVRARFGSGLLAAASARGIFGFQRLLRIPSALGLIG